jgi:membrane protease YdiL (CAAX protease family)
VPKNEVGDILEPMSEPPESEPQSHEADGWQYDQAPPVIPMARAVTPPQPTSVTGIDLIIGVAICWGVELGGGFVIGVVAGLTQSPLGEDSGEFMPPAELLLPAALFSGFTAALVSWYFVCRKYGKSLKDGFRLHSIGILVPVTCVLLGLASAVVMGGVSGHEDTQDSFMAELVSSQSGLVALVILFLVLPPFEELYYRGFIFTVLRNTLGPAGAVILVTLWFGAAHSLQLAGDWLALACVCTMGLIWTVLREVTKSLWPSMIAHWTYNATLVVLALLLGAAD